MLLIFDIGNSIIKVAVYNGDDRISFAKYAVSEIEFKEIKEYKIDAVAISSVVPDNTEKIKQLVKEHFNIEPFILSRYCKFNLKNDYATPDTLGMDRLCGCEGAYSLFRNDKSKTNEKPIITIDLGTATTINLIKPGGVFAGGIIAPGIETMNKTLHKQTAQLPEVDLSEYIGLIGNDTKSSIAAGIIISTIGLIEKTISELQKDFGQIPEIYLTGGNAFKIIPHISFDYEYVDDLVLRGIKAIHSLNTNRTT